MLKINEEKYIGSAGYFSLYPENINKLELIETNICIWFSNNEQPDLILGHENKNHAQVSLKGLEKLCKKTQFKVLDFKKDV